MKCFVKSCGNDFHGRNRSLISKHRFPKNSLWRQQWLQIIANAENRNIDTASVNFNSIRICSDHFAKDCFISVHPKKILRGNVSPTIFHGCAMDTQLLAPLLTNCEGSKTGTTQDTGTLPSTASTMEKKNVEKMTRKCLKEYPRIKARLQNMRLVTKRLKAQNKRLREKVRSMEDLLNRLQKKRLVTEENDQHLRALSTNLLFRELIQHKPRQPYSEALRKFATTLHFYSSRAYVYVRGVFRNTLPHPRTIIRWYVAMDGNPGITGESLKALRRKAQAMRQSGKPLLCCVVMDEMAIRQQVSWNEHSGKLEGIANNSWNTGAVFEAVGATEALVFMATGIQEAWKIPLGYFLINGMNAEDKKEIILTIIKNLHEAGVTVITFTFDGTRTNISTANALGCELETHSKSFRTSFEHPCTNQDIFVILDIVHMLKLVRNTLFNKGSIGTVHGPARWQDIENLNKFQKASGVVLAPKLTDKHVNFKNSKMKVALAVQTISQSVGSALRSLREYHPDFEDCSGTIEYVEIFNDLFDVFNSMYEKDVHFKAPLSLTNFDNYHHAFEYAVEYIKKLTLPDGTPILHSANKTGFLGFIVAIESFRNIFRIYVEEKQIIERVYTYRFSQDHIEIFFGAIRTRGGSNNNPNAAQFKSAYKRLLKHSEVVCSAEGNCTDMNVTATLEVEMETGKTSGPISFETDVDYPSFVELSTDLDSFLSDPLVHSSILKLAPMVQKRTRLGLKCEHCLHTLLNDAMNSIVLICKFAEMEFKGLLNGRTNVNVEHFYRQLLATILAHCEANYASIFQALQSSTDAEHQHKTSLVQRIIKVYIDFKFRQYAKGIIPFKETNRQKLTKLILFQGN